MGHKGDSGLTDAPMSPFSERLAEAVRRCHSPLCVGIDPHPERMPPGEDDEAAAAMLEPTWGPDARRAVEAAKALHFGETVIAASRGRVPAVKPQFAFFEALGAPGMVALARLCRQAQEAGLLVVGDGKRGDIASTAAAYARSQLGPEAPFPCDASTVAPYLGPDSLEPFAQQARQVGGGIFVLVRTSNPGSAAWQATIFREVARWVAEAGAREPDRYGLSGVGAVVGATWPGLLEEMREKMPHAWLLLPGFGAQGATAADTRGAFRPDGLGALVVGARGLTFPESPVEDQEGFIIGRIEAANRALREVVAC